MLRLFWTTLFGAVLAAFVATPASAQGYDPFCLDQVVLICGDTSAGQCFSDGNNWAYVDDFCVGDVQSMIEDENDFYNSGGNDPQPEVDYGNNFSAAGLTYGGKLRSGPGTEYSDVGSLAEGEPITIIEASGVWSDGYQWYYISTPYGDAYQWGGILCANPAYEGIYGQC